MFDITPFLGWLKEIITNKEKHICTCGYKFKLEYYTNICEKCFDKFLKFNEKKKDRMKRRSKRDPFICPICKETLSQEGKKGLALRCPKCKKITLARKE